MRTFHVLLLLILCSFSIARAQTPVLPAPKGWSGETMSFPIEFAPAIPYQGTETLLFAEGWSDPKSEEFWSYCFVWMINAGSQVDASTLHRDIEAYYKGLVGRNIVNRKIPKEKLVPVVVDVKDVAEAPGDLKTYSATVNMLDYMDQHPIALRLRIHVKDCAAPARRAVFFAISPQGSEHPVWQKFDAIWSAFRCDGK